MGITNENTVAIIKCHTSPEEAKKILSDAAKLWADWGPSSKKSQAEALRMLIPILPDLRVIDSGPLLTGHYRLTFLDDFGALKNYVHIEKQFHCEENNDDCATEV